MSPGQSIGMFRTMLTLVLLAAPASESSLAPVPASLQQLLDEACADLPEATCAPLYTVLDTLRAVLGQPEAAFCCEACKASKPGEGRAIYSCSGCGEKGPAWVCGSLRHSRRTVQVECSGSHVLDTTSGALDCF